MNKNGISLSNILILLFVAVVFLIYGISIGRYQIFPFDILKSIVATEEQRLMASESFTYTSLQRLHISKVSLPDDKANGGAMITSGTDVIIVDRQGAMIVLDFTNFQKMEVKVPQVPMGLDKVEEQGWPERDDFEPTKMRVKGAYADRLSENEIDLYVTHHYYNGECFMSKLSRIKLLKRSYRVESLGDWEELYRTTPCLYPDSDLSDEDKSLKRWVFGGHISGGKLIRYDEDHLLFSIGDHFYDGYDKEPYAMDEDNSYGKFILFNTRTLEDRIFAIGTRNAQGLYRDQDGVIWSTEHGPDGGDELNIIREGNNYGWPMETFGIQYSHIPWVLSERQGRHDQYTQPLFAWLGSIAPSELLKIEEDKFNLWQGDLIVTTLKDKSFHRLRPSPDNTRILYDEKVNIGHRIRNIVELYDGSLLLRTDDNYIIHIDDAGPVYEEFDYDSFLSKNEIARRFKEFQDDKKNTEPIENGGLVFERSCSMCHSKGQLSNIGPHLKDLKNRRVGSVDDFDYSTSMEVSGQVWDEELLKKYIKSPQNTFPGTKMSNVQLTDREIELISDYLLNN